MLVLLCILPLILFSCQKDTTDDNILTGIYAPVFEYPYAELIPTQDGFYTVEYVNTAGLDEDHCDLLTLDKEGNVTETTPIELDLNDFHLHRLAGVGEKGVYIYDDEAFWMIDWDGSFRGSVSLSELSLTWEKAYNTDVLEYGDQILICYGKKVQVINKDGSLSDPWTLTNTCQYATVEVEHLWLMTVDQGNDFYLEKWQNGEMLESYAVSEDVIQQWHGGEHMITCEDGWLYGWKSSIGVFRWNFTNVENELEVVLDLMASGFNSSNVKDIQKLPGEDEYVITTSVQNDPYNNFGGSSTSRSYVKRAPDKDLSEMHVLHLVCYSSDEEMQNAVLRFNREHTDAYIRITTYSQYGVSDGMSGQDRMELDLNSGVVQADILAGYTLEPMDLYPFMTGEIQSEDIAQCVKNAYEVDGKLYQIGTNITFSSRIGKRESFGEMTHWNLEQFLDYVDNLGEDEYMMEYISQDSAWKLLSYDVYSNFIDGNTAHFDDPLYIRLLEYIATLPLEEDEIMEHGVDNRDQLAAGDFEGEFQLQYEPGGENLYYTGKLKLYNHEYGSGSSFRYMYEILRLCKEFCTTDIALIGYPINADSGVDVFYTSTSYSIPVNCTDPALAWEFIESILIDSKVVPDTSSKAYENMNFQFTTLQEPYMTYLETLATMEDIGVSLDEEAREYSGIDKLTVDEMVVNWMHLLYDTAGYQASVPWDVRNIIKEEMSRYLAGAVTAEVCADATQSRVQLYLDENG